jgi:ABC-type transport system involved in cytochrome c biogenesis permease subunit
MSFGLLLYLYCDVVPLVFSYTFLYFLLFITLLVHMAQPAQQQFDFVE